jgi:hypothetical protein
MKLLLLFLLGFRQSWFLVININAVLGLLHLVVSGDDADVSGVYVASVLKLEVHYSTFKMETACTSKALPLWPTTTWCNNSRTEIKSNHIIRKI